MLWQVCNKQENNKNIIVYEKEEECWVEGNLPLFIRLFCYRV